MFDINPNINYKETKQNGNQKTVLVIDWSNLMFRSLFLHNLYNGSSGYEYMEDLKSYINKFAIDICSIINSVKPVHTIICTDSQSAWRKQILPGEDGYKGNRMKDPNINWDNIFKCSNDLLHILEKHGACVASVEHAEADDMMACVKEVIFSDFPEYSIIIVSSDADIRQLIEFNADTKQYCIVYNTTTKISTKKKHLYVTQMFHDWLFAPDVCDIFFTGYTIDNQKQYVNEFLNTNPNIELVVENPELVLINKILCGDDGDNVPSFYSFYKNDRVVRVTPKKAEKLMSLIKANNVIELCNNAGKINEALETIFKRTINDVNCIERLDRQRRLVELNSKMFPDNIRDYKETIRYMISNVKPSNFQYLKAVELLKGTEYEGYDKRQALEADVFKDFEKLRKGNSIKKKKEPDIRYNTAWQNPFNIDALF